MGGQRLFIAPERIAAFGGRGGRSLWTCASSCSRYPTIRCRLGCLRPRAQPFLAAWPGAVFRAAEQHC